MCARMRMHWEACIGVQSRVLDPPGAGVNVIVSCPAWALGTELGSSARAVPLLTAEPSLSSAVHIPHSAQAVPGTVLDNLAPSCGRGDTGLSSQLHGRWTREN